LSTSNAPPRAEPRLPGIQQQAAPPPEEATMPRSTPFIHVNSALDADIAAVARRAEKWVTLAVDKAIAHSIDAAAFPLQRGTLEHLLAQRLRQAPPANTKKGEKAADMKAEKARRVAAAQKRWRERYTSGGRPKAAHARHLAHLGPLASTVNLASKKPIADQLPADFFFGDSSAQMKARLTALAKPLDRAVAASVDAHRWFDELIGATGTTTPQPPSRTTVQCLVREVKCIDETNGFAGTEAGADEIRLGGLSVDPCAVVRRIASFHVKDYESDGETKVYAAPDYKLFADFSLQAPGEWPRAFFATFVLAEQDMGGFGEFLSELVDLVRMRLAAELAAALGPEVAAALVAAGVAGAVAAAVAIVLMLVVFVVVLAIFEAIKNAWEDDIFKPQTVMISLESLAAADAIDYPAQNLWGVLNFIGHGGQYQLHYSWRCR
jgi:hypothetical protein